MIRTENIELQKAHDYVKARIISMGQFAVLYLSGSPATVDGSNSKINWNLSSDILGLGGPSDGPKFNVYGDAFFNGRIGLYDQDPVDPYVPEGASGFTQNSGSYTYAESYWTGDIPGYNYTVGDIVRALKLLGILQM